MNLTKNVTVIGLGYIGLPTSALLASVGYVVQGMDVSSVAVETINQGKIHIVEPDLDAYVRSAVASGRLRAFAYAQPADVYLICVPTPFHENGEIPQPNVDYVLSAAREIGPLLKAGDLVILESTSPVGTTEAISEIFREIGVDLESIHIAYCPERVLPGKIMRELVENDRIVGGLRPDSATQVANFYRSFVRGEVLETDAKTAEMCKLTENSFRDVNIAFANELSLICDKEGINVWDLIRLANRHPRVNILQPGAGVGGHCIAVDPWFIVARDVENSRLIRTAREVNNYKAEWVVEQIKTAVAVAKEKKGKRPKVICLGLAFKPDIDDLRESPARAVASSLLSQGYEIAAVEPNIESSGAFDLVSLETAIREADILVALVKHQQFVAAAEQGLFVDSNLIDFCGLLES